MKIGKYDRNNAVQYAHKWAYSRNPKYYNFDPVGGDCTSFASQCIHAGCKIMNYDKNKGWYYNNGNDKSPSWSGVEFLYQFLIGNKGVGPFAKEVEAKELEKGDIAQLSFDGEKYGHSLVVVETEGISDLGKILVATHTFDSDYRRIATYQFKEIRYIHIEGVRMYS